MLSRIFCILVGSIYLYLALWCSFSPAETSRIVGFTLHPGAGDSEFLTVYGGLEFGLALLFLLPALQPPRTGFVLQAILLIHASLVLFRSISFLMFSGIPTATQQLAAAEWAIFILAAILTFLSRPSPPN